MHRYAIYHSPSPHSLLGQFGAAWLGRDVWGQQTHGPPGLLKISVNDWSRAVEAPRGYGFHATLKPPFRLTPRYDEASLLDSVRELCRIQPPVMTGRLVPGRILDFLALIPEVEEAGEWPAINRLAGACVRALDVFRAPLTGTEYLARNTPRLTPVQRALLHRWGYPWVMQSYRFHLTLTGALSPADQNRFLNEINQLVTPDLKEPHIVDALCLFGQRKPDTHFEMLERFRLSGSTRAPSIDA